MPRITNLAVKKEYLNRVPYSLSLTAETDDKRVYTTSIPLPLEIEDFMEAMTLATDDLLLKIEEHNRD